MSKPVATKYLLSVAGVVLYGVTATICIAHLENVKPGPLMIVTFTAFTVLNAIIWWDENRRGAMGIGPISLLVVGIILLPLVAWMFAVSAWLIMPSMNNNYDAWIEAVSQAEEDSQQRMKAVHGIKDSLKGMGVTTPDGEKGKIVDIRLADGSEYVSLSSAVVRIEKAEESGDSTHYRYQNLMESNPQLLQVEIDILKMHRDRKDANEIYERIKSERGQ